jgi:hypothetical protein
MIASLGSFLQRFALRVIVSQQLISNLLDGMILLSNIIRFLASHTFQAIAINMVAHSLR